MTGWRRKPFRSRQHVLDWALEMLGRRPDDPRRALELVVDAAVREGWRRAHDVRDRELRDALRIGIDRDPGGYEPWDPPGSTARDMLAAAAQAAGVDVTREQERDGGDRTEAVTPGPETVDRSHPGPVESSAKVRAGRANPSKVRRSRPRGA